MDRLEFNKLRGGEKFEVGTESGSIYELAVELAPQLVGGSMFRGFRLTRKGREIVGEPQPGLASGNNIDDEPVILFPFSDEHGVLSTNRRIEVLSDSDHEQNSGNPAFSPFTTSKVVEILPVAEHGTEDDNADQSPKNNEPFVLNKLPELGLPTQQYIIVGSGVLDVLGIRMANDIDFVTSPEVYASLESQGWSRAKDSPSLVNDDFEVYLTWDSKDGQPNFEDLLGSKLVIRGYNFVNLERLLDWKKRVGRPKDLKDIELIERYLKTDK